MQTAELAPRPTIDIARASPPQYDMIHPHAQTGVHLPDLKTVLSPEFQHSFPTQSTFVAHGSPAATGLPRIEPHMQSNGARTSMERVVVSPSETSSVVDLEYQNNRAKSGVSLEDQNVRDVAEALVGLGRSLHSSSGNSVQLPPHVTPSLGAPRNSHRVEPEPLLELLTQAHPFVGGTINGSMSVYSGAKSYAPRFVQASINLAERNIGSPMVNAVGSVGRFTGAESVARWYLTPKEQSETHSDNGHIRRGKRRRAMNDEMDIESGVRSPRTAMRHDSVGSRADSLPPYRASKPPSYREAASPDRAHPYDMTANRTWSQQFVLSASGLGVAVSDTSRRSLTYCLQLLGRSAEHIATVSDALKLVLEQYDQARDNWHQKHSPPTREGERPRTPEHDDSARRLAGIIQKHCDDIWETLKGVVHSVSVSAGGALPNNAREFVRDQLMSLPRRWRAVSDSQTMESDTSRSAHRMIAFATEGLDMINQVSQMCRATLDSAEGWINMVGRRRQQQQQQEGEEEGGEREREREKRQHHLHIVEEKPHGYHEYDDVMGNTDESQAAQPGEKR